MTPTARGDATLIVFAKAPVSGRVKTRLCPPCTPDQAAAIAHAALVDTLAAVAATPGVHRVLALDGEPGSWSPAGFDVVPQTAGDLAARLTGAFACVSGPALVIGMDTPQLTPGMLRHAVDTLLSPGVDAVLGRTVDGGWWTLGLRDVRVPAFTGVPMSTRETGRHQAARLNSLGLRTRALEVETDVDTFVDARTVASRIPTSRFARAVGTVERRLSCELGLPA